jgi:phosphoserine phosphatase
MEKIAFFDFDNTIYDGYTYQDFIDFASENILKDDKFQVKAKNILKNTTDYNKIVVGIAEVVSEIITGWQYEKFVESCRIACNRKKMLDWVIPVTNFLTSEGFKNILVTASFEEMLVDSLLALKIDKTFCSYFEKVDDIYTGKIELLLNDGKKADAIKGMVSSGDTFSIAFGDSMGDAPMLDAVNMAFLVRSNNNEIETMAKEKKWNLGSDPKVIIEKIRKALS